MSEPQIEFRWLDAKCTGSDTVIFRLEDGAVVKVKVDIDRAGVATNFTNPDGTPHYNIGAGLKLTVIPANRKFSVPKSQIGVAPPKRPDKSPVIT